MNFLKLCDIVFQQMFVRRMASLQPVDEGWGDNIITTVVNSGKLVLEMVYVALEVVIWPYRDSQHVVVLLLDFLTGGILGEEYLIHLFEVAEGV